MSARVCREDASAATRQKGKRRGWQIPVGYVYRDGLTRAADRHLARRFARRSGIRLRPGIDADLAQRHKAAWLQVPVRPRDELARWRVALASVAAVGCRTPMRPSASPSA